MAGIERIKTKILDDARKTADETLSRARREAEQIIQDARLKAEKETEKARQAAMVEAEDMRKSVEAVSSLEKESGCSRYGRTWWTGHLRKPLTKF